jgi:hypothetical protein
VEAPSPGRVLHQAHRAVVVRNNLGAEAVVYAGRPAWVSGQILHAGSLPWPHERRCVGVSCHLSHGPTTSALAAPAAADSPSASFTASGLPFPQALDDAQIHHERRAGDVCTNHHVYLLRRREARQLAGGGGRLEAGRDEPFP